MQGSTIGSLVWEYSNKLRHSISVVPLQPTPTSKFLQGYVGAVTSAVSIAVSFLIY